MDRGRRYDGEPKLNMKKVFAVIIAIVVMIMFIFIIKGILKKDDGTGKIVSKSYFTSYKDNKWGVIDSLGNTVIDPSYQEMIVIPNSKTPVFICTYDINYTTGEYKTKVLNQKNEEIFKDYDRVEAIQNIAPNNNLWYEQSVLKFYKDGKYGLIDLTGKKIVSNEYEEIIPVVGIQNSFKVKKDGKYGIADVDGKIVVQPKYIDIDVLGKDNKSGFIVKDETGKCGIIDYSNNVVLQNQYDSIQKVYGNDLYVVTIAGKQKVINKENADVLTAGFDSVEQILPSQENAVIFKKDNNYVIMSLTGEILIDAQYDSLKEAKVGMFIAQSANLYGIISINRDSKLGFDYSSIVYNEKADLFIAEDSNLNASILNGNLEVKAQGLLIDLNTEKGYFKLRVDDSFKYYNFKFEEKQETEIFTTRTLFLSKKDGKYGYVDKKGKIIVEHLYDDATEQNDYGFVAVKKDGKWGSIDNKGNVVQEPAFNLDDYLLINFIGKWHFGKDINMNYYNQL